MRGDSQSNSEPSGRRTTVGVLVVDDQARFRRVARAVIEATAGFVPIGDAASGADALASANRLHPDLVLMDVHMPGMDGFEAARSLGETHPETVVVLVSLEDMAGLDLALTSCGATGFIRKQDLAPRTLRRLWELYGPKS